MSDDRKISYFNTLIFTIITAIASLAVLALLFFPFGKDFIFFIIAYEIGVFLIIAYCVYKIIRGDKDLRDQRASFVVRFDECPDFYTKNLHKEDNKLWCHNDYKVVDTATKQEYIYRIYPLKVDNAEVNLPKTIDLAARNNPAYTQFELKKLETDDKYETYQKKCSVLYKNPRSGNSAYNSFQDLPWTYAKSRCESLGR